MRPSRDFFTVGVLPPILMLVTVTLLAITRAEAVARAEDGLVQAIVSGLSHHSLALVIGYLLALAVLVVRVRVKVQRELLTRTDPGRRLRA